jgi:hypothetical protein
LFVANANWNGCLWPFHGAAMGDWQVYIHETGDQLGKHDQRLLNPKMAARG